MILLLDPGNLIADYFLPGWAMVAAATAHADCGVMRGRGLGCLGSPAASSAFGEQHRCHQPGLSRIDSDLGGHPGLGFGAAAATLAALTGLDQFVYEAKQAAVARYSRTGFEAAAVTALAVAAAMLPRTRQGLMRSAELRFGQPFAVVAVADGQDHHARRPTPEPSPWRGLPVFSAWITEPEDADDLADQA